MSKKHFTETEIEILSNNRYVKSVSSKGVTYTDEFKRIFIVENENGKLPRYIFEENGFDIEVIGIVRVQRAASRGVLLIINQEYLDLEIRVKKIRGDPLRKSFL